MYKKYIKRLLDIAISLCSLLILSPVIMIVAILVRSMSDKKDKNGKLLPDKDRLTKFGRILRSTSLDELPELVNILKGEMSLIGPRPLAVAYLPYYNEEEKHRHDVRPGLTGLAQINGRNALNWEERFSYDIEYVNNITFINDLKIIFKTFYKVIKKDGVVTRGTGKTIDFDEYRKKTIRRK